MAEPTVPERRCDGSTRCGYHHAVAGVYRCCCGLPWVNKSCASGAKARDKVAPTAPVTAEDRHPIEALLDVRCEHERHQWMCVNCAADAMRPEVERLRVELAGMIAARRVLADAVTRLTAERDELAQAVAQMKALAEQAEKRTVYAPKRVIDASAVMDIVEAHRDR